MDEYDWSFENLLEQPAKSTCIQESHKEHPQTMSEDLKNYHRQNGPHTRISWDDVCPKLTNWNNRPIERERLRGHLKHRKFGPHTDDGVEYLINHAIIAGILEERSDNTLEYTPDLVTLELAVGEFRLEIQSD